MSRVRVRMNTSHFGGLHRTFATPTATEEDKLCNPKWQKMIGMEYNSKQKWSMIVILL